MNDQLGAGLSPAGFGFAGFGVPEQDDAIINSGLDGKGVSVRYINPFTGDYEMNSKGQLIGANGTQMAVMLALRTKKDSSSQFGFGQNVSSIRVISPNIEAQINSYVKQALNYLIVSKQIELVGIEVSRNDSRITMRVRWIDVKAMEEKEITHVL